MVSLKGMVVMLETESDTYAGTDEHLYIGVVGTGGGREFPLDVHGFNDFEKGTNVKYWLGDVWDGGALAGAKNPWESKTGDWNDPGKFDIDLDKVTHVYLRKQSYKANDDAWKMAFVVVTLYGPSPQKRTFKSTKEMWLGNEYGLQLWLSG